MPRKARNSALVLALLAVGQFAFAQKPKNEPRRPKFPVGVDTNNAQVYYDYGSEQLERDPEKAADSFYWAIRLNPIQAESYYARRCALLLSDRYRFEKYYEEDRRTIQSDEVKRIDSLKLYALTINPFLYTKFELRLWRRYIDIIAEDIARNNNVNTGEVRYELDRIIARWPVSQRAFEAYGEGRFDDALRLYGEAIKQARFKTDYRIQRGRLFFQLDQSDSALAQLTTALEEERKMDKKDLVYLYNSKEVLEQSIGLVQQRLGNTAAAKEAFGRALEENLSYFPAHVQLGYLALEAKDTTTALSEMDLAVQIRGDDPALRYIYGYSLAMSGKFKDAEVQLRKAIELDPVFALPYNALGEVLDKQSRGDEALVQYRSFLALASKTDLRRQAVESRVQVLASKGGQ
ncbi:MAG TPA: tetratricopeptide repeat protein [Gemmatimonadaceae bacterium]|nr:tetratricopeptide repeat protein [Gemmatimonadaceae bacterium]